MFKNMNTNESNDYPYSLRNVFLTIPRIHKKRNIRLYAAAETLTVTDAQLGGGGAANLTFNVATIGTGDAAGATTLVYCNDEDWFAYDKAIAANATDRITGVVVGPGQNILVYSSAADISYAVTGFESNADDYVVLSVSKNAAGGDTP